MSSTATRRPAVAVKYFRGTGPFAVLGRGLADLVLVDLVGSRCYVVVEWGRRSDVIREIRVQQDRRVDPSTRVTPKLIAPTIFVEGTLQTTETSSSWSIRTRDIASGTIIGSDSGRAPNVIDAASGIARRLRAQLEKELCGRFTGTFSGRTREGAGGFEFEYSFSGTVTFTRADDADPRPGFTSYTIEKISFRTTGTLSGMCAGTASESVSLGRDDQPGNALHVARATTPGKGRRYEISFTVERPARGVLKATCSGTAIDYPWALVAQVITTPAELYTDAGATRLRGTHTVPGTPITYAWDLRRGG